VNEQLLSGGVTERVVRKRQRRDPKPRFKVNTSHQLDAVQGCPALSVPERHLARGLWEVITRLDTSALEEPYSSMGRHGYHPRNVLAVWVYASLIGMHHSTKVAAAIKTDAAFRLLSGGHAISGATLRRFRSRNAHFFAQCIKQTIELASRLGLIDIEALAVDSVRIRAHASSAAARSVSRSTKRLEELSSVDETVLNEAEREKHRAKLKKHHTALELCRQRGRTSIVLTNEAAALMKFPSGASAPAHRATVVATGTSARFVIGILVDADSTDHGKLGDALCKARDTLDSLGLRNGRRLVVAADAGYAYDDDFEFAFNNSSWADVLIPERSIGRYGRFFGRERFIVHPDLTAICPAGTPMLGPYGNSKANAGDLKWVGVGCSTCPLKAQCTDGKVRSLNVDLRREEHRRFMEERMQKPGATERYNQRISTVEPVFSYIESTMNFRRCSSRATSTVHSEILLKILAYNIDRLIRAERESRKLCCVWFLFE
jgi:transposase